jgi:hypothetical protein
VLAQSPPEVGGLADVDGGEVSGSRIEDSQHINPRDCRRNPENLGAAEHERACPEDLYIFACASHGNHFQYEQLPAKTRLVKAPSPDWELYTYWMTIATSLTFKKIC